MKGINALILVLLITITSSCQVNKVPDKEIKILIEEFNKKDFKSVIDKGNKLIENYPNDNSLYFILGKTYFSMNNYNEAFRCLDKSIEINPNHGESYSYRAIMKSLRGNYSAENVLSDYNNALEVNPDNINLLKSKANYLRKKRCYSEAIEELDKILQLDSLNYSALILKANILGIMNRNDESLSLYSKLIQIYPEKTLAYDERGFLHLKLGQFSKALKDFKETVRLDQLRPQSQMISAFGYNNRGYAYYKIGELSNALNDINHSIELFDKNSYAYRNRALVNISLNKSEKVCNDLSIAIQLGFTKDYGNEVLTLIEENCK